MRAVALCVLALAAAACSANHCNKNTVLLTVSLTNGADTADFIDVTVSIDGAAPQTQTVSHQPGSGSGTIEVDFSTYPAWKSLEFTATARSDSQTLASTSETTVAASTCTTLSLQLDGSVFDLSQQLDDGTDGSTPPLCGDGVVEPDAGEICDRGADNLNCNGCSQDCKSNETCGNGIIDSCKKEVCDDGVNNASPTSGTCPTQHCSADCKSDLTCGNGIIDTCKGETCDDGPLNGQIPAHCSPNCHINGEFCGNGVVDIGEQCDPGIDFSASNACGGANCPAETPTCNRDCAVSRCGDGIVNLAAGEQCDDGKETARCNVNCTLAACGDGIVNATAGEQCDSGSGTSTPACKAMCSTTPACTMQSCTVEGCIINCSLTADTLHCYGNGAGALSCHGK